MVDLSPVDLSTVLALSESGDADLLTDDESALLPSPSLSASAFGANLALTLDDSTLTDIGRTVFEGYEADEAGRRDWIEREKRGIRLLGISDKLDAPPPFVGGSCAVFPGLIEAVIQFQARAMAEVWPPEGPAKALVEGQALNFEREMQAERVARYLNWLYCDRMPGGYQQHDRMLFRLALSGSCFKKVFYDSIAECVVSRFVPVDKLIVPYGSSDLETTPRITHVLEYSGSGLGQLMNSGVYREIDLASLDEAEAVTALQPEIDRVTGSTPSTADTDTDFRTDKHSRARFDRAAQVICLEQSVRLDLDGEPENAPYLVTIERDTQAVLAIYRDWRELDEKHKRRSRYVHFYFLPGLDGFYGTGLLHVLGRLAESQSGILRSLTDAAMLANLRGGFRSADVRLPRGNRTDGLSIKPGEWLPVDATAEELQKLFVSIPYSEPSQALFNLLQWLDGVFRRISGTTSELVGEESKSVPVGTTLARIEQGMKVQTEIQIRIHQAQARELALVAEVTADSLPDFAYCRDVLGIAPDEFARDFDGRVDVRPVSDPNTITGVQRMAIAQALVDLSDKAPDLFDRREVYRRLLETMRTTNIDAIMPPPQQTQRAGPVEENMSLTMMRPVKTFPDQDHLAHLIVHRQWLSMLDPDTLKRVEAAAIAHIAEHQAWLYRLQMQQAMGMQLPAGPLGDQQQSDPQTENMIAMMAAQAAQIMSQQQQQPQIDPTAALAAQRAEIEDAKAAADIRRKDAIAQASIARDDQAASAKLNRDVAEQEARLIARFMSRAGLQALGQPQPNEGLPSTEGLPQ